MGNITHQYSAEEILEKYQRHVSSYKEIIIKLKCLIKTSYNKEKIVSYFLSEHLEFCSEVVNLLEDAIKLIQNGMVDENICMRLETLFNQCSEEQKRLVDTDKRIIYEKSDRYAQYVNVYRKLREECDDLGYCDETVKFVKSLIGTSNKYSISIYGDVTGTQFQQGTKDSIQKQVGANSIRNASISAYTKLEETSIKDILKHKLVDAIVGILFTILTIALKLLMDADIYSSFNSIARIFMLIIWILCCLGTAVFVIAFLTDLLNIGLLTRKGKFVEFQSKREILIIILSALSSEGSAEGMRCVGKTYKNIEGKIYEIKYIECPYCKSEPIGNMYLRKDIKKDVYMWICPENSTHRVKFDYKQKLLS